MRPPQPQVFDYLLFAGVFVADGEVVVALVAVVVVVVAAAVENWRRPAELKCGSTQMTEVDLMRL